MKEIKKLYVQLKDGTIRECSLEISKSQPLIINYIGPILKKRKIENDDLFNALIMLRRELEAEGGNLLCNGARFDVYPSGMSREMGGGRKAYVLHQGSPALRDDLVDILDYSSPEFVGTIKQQEEFYEKWVSSLRKLKK